MISRSCKDVGSEDILSKGPVKQWLKAIKATEQDFKLMLASLG